MLALTLILLPVLATAQLTSSQKLVTQVPFEFMVANKHIPAGECIVQSAVMGARTLLVRNVAAKISLFAPANPGETKKAASSYALVFHKYGDQYFLTGIRLAADRTIYRLPESKAEAEIRAQNVPATEEILVASLK
jgi:hypothetical protein